MTTEADLPPPAAPSQGRRVLIILVELVLVAALLVGGTLLAGYLIATGPEAKKKRPPARAHLVDVAAVAFGPQPTVVHVMGTVCPARSVELHPRVNGEIVEVSREFVPGGRFRSGETILRIDREDYALAVERSRFNLTQSELSIERTALAIDQKQSDVARTEGELKLELGQQALAKREFEMLGQGVTDAEKELVLRAPQLRTIQAAEQAAKASLNEAKVARKTAEAANLDARNTLKKAELDLARTVIQAPFNAVIQDRDVDLGATVSTTSRLATLLGTDECWVEVAVPVDQLRWIRIPQKTGEAGSPARIFNEAAWGKDRFRKGYVCRLASDLEPQGRMARLLICVQDPLALAEDNCDQPALLQGSYVRVEIEGQEIASAAPVSRSLLRDGDNVWVMAGDVLEIRPVTVGFRGRDQVLVTAGLKPTDRLVTTDLAAPTAGMPLRLRAAGVAGPEGAKAPPPDKAAAATAPDAPAPARAAP